MKFTVVSIEKREGSRRVPGKGVNEKCDIHTVGVEPVLTSNEDTTLAGSLTVTTPVGGSLKFEVGKTYEL
jgi:hypothetical protein